MPIRVQFFLLRSKVAIGFGNVYTRVMHGNAFQCLSCEPGTFAEVSRFFFVQKGDKAAPARLETLAHFIYHPKIFAYKPHPITA